MLKKILFILLFFLSFTIGSPLLMFSAEFNLNDAIKLKGKVLKKRKGVIYLKIKEGFCRGVHIFKVLNEDSLEKVREEAELDFFLLEDCRDFSKIYLPQQK